MPGDGAAAKSRKIVTKRLCGKFAMRVSGVHTYVHIELGWVVWEREKLCDCEGSWTTTDFAPGNGRT